MSRCSAKRWRLSVAALLLAFGMTACTRPVTVLSGPLPPIETRPTPLLNDLPIAMSNAGVQRLTAAPRIIRGTGRLVGEPAPGPLEYGLTGEPVTLDFANADVRDVARSVLGDVLKVPYVIDPAAQGTITLQSAGPIARGRVVPELASALRLAGLAVVENGGLYKVVPLAQAGREVQLSAGGGSGFVAKIVTPRYAGAAELERLLQPLVPNGTSLRAEPSRNVLIISGPAQDVTALLGNLAVFDVDTLRGMSTALLPLKVADARDITKEVNSLLAGLGDSGQLVRIVPLERINAVLVTAMRPDYIERIRRWVDNLDKGGSSSERQLFVYDVQNGRATDLADVLRKALGLSGHDSDTPSSAASGGTAGGSGSSTVGDVNSQGGLSGQSSSGTGNAQNPLLGGLTAGGLGGAGAPTAASTSTRESGGAGEALTSDQAKSGILVTADPINNALLIRATSQEYSTIAAALRRLDHPPLQVMLETTIAEVTLTDQLAYGLQYYLKSGNLQAIFAAPGAGSTSAPFSGFGFASGLNLAYGTIGGSTAILQLLQQLTQVRVLSSPNIFVSNNQAARIQVGDQVPIATGSATSTIGSNSPIVNSIEYRDTGVILRVIPRVNAGGMVSLDVGEEVSSVSTTTTSTLDSPTISERRLDTTVSVSDGQTVALGGLISDSRTRSKNGIPVLQDIPGLGWLFGQRNNQFKRTELIAILTPHVVRTAVDMRAITEELQRKLPMTLPVRYGQP